MAASENKAAAPLARYRQKRDFARTPEPGAAPAEPAVKADGELPE